MAARVLIVAACLLASRAARADDADERVAATRISRNPLPITEALKFDPSYTFEHGSTRYKAELQFEPVLPYEGTLIPGLDIGHIWSIVRVQLTTESLQDSSGTFGGLENLNIVDVAARKFGALTLGAGVATVFPMATSPELGPAKWQLGPAGAFDYEPERALSIAALVQALWSVAGSDQVARQSYVTVQPVVTIHFDNGMLLGSDAQMSFFWRGGDSTVPVDLGLGYAFSKHFVGTIKGTRTVWGQNDGEMKAELEFTFLP